MSIKPAKRDPDLALVLQSIERDPELAGSTKHKYERAVVRYTEAGHSLTDAQALANYAEDASSSERAFLSAAQLMKSGGLDEQELTNNRDNTVKDALDQNDTLIEAGPDAPEVATCPACGGIVDLRSRRTGRNPDNKTWYYRHRWGEGPHCPRRSG